MTGIVVYVVYELLILKQMRTRSNGVDKFKFGTEIVKKMSH